ncbi:MAG: fibroblast growth factor [Candidatus Cloacimonetes bacterium]|nr:fibroblast growth factor [Candidatus Cloacimonadota bacterium]MDY0230755.1 fibroblast growth factor [Candidatus Cloacimonadaceae bacterium]
MTAEREIKSFHQHIRETTGRILYEEELPSNGVIPPTLVAIIDLLSNYNEEGKQLFPEIIVTPSLVEITRQLPSIQIIHIGEDEIGSSQAQNALKKCAPLAKNGWTIFIEIDGHNFKYGLIAGESSELSPTLYRNIFGDMKSDECSTSGLHISNAGQGVVRIKGFKTEVYICLNLKEKQIYSADKLSKLVSEITKRSDNSKEETYNFLIRALELSLQNCHGSLIGVVEDKENYITKLKERIPDAIYLSPPIDISELIETHTLSPTPEASTTLRLNKTIIDGMLNSDGITIFSDKSKIIAFNAFIENQQASRSENNRGGARKRAYQSMCTINCFKFCYYQSQDGPVEEWSHP